MVEQFPLNQNQFQWQQAQQILELLSTIWDGNVETYHGTFLQENMHHIFKLR